MTIATKTHPIVLSTMHKGCAWSAYAESAEISMFSSQIISSITISVDKSSADGRKKESDI